MVANSCSMNNTALNSLTKTVQNKLTNYVSHTRLPVQTFNFLKSENISSLPSLKMSSRVNQNTETKEFYKGRELDSEVQGCLSGVSLKGSRDKTKQFIRITFGPLSNQHKLGTVNYKRMSEDIFGEIGNLQVILNKHYTYLRNKFM